MVWMDHAMVKNRKQCKGRDIENPRVKRQKEGKLREGQGGSVVSIGVPVTKGNIYM